MTLLLGVCSIIVGAVDPPPVRALVPVVQTFSDGTDQDQDDMAVWVHPTDPSLSTIITTDKQAGTVYVYDLDGAVLQAFASPQPGNVDVRYGFGLGGECVDLVAFNERSEDVVRVYAVDAATRELTRVDQGDIDVGGNYGFTLYRHADGRLFAHTGPKSSGSVISQYELVDDGSGHVTGEATGWQFDESTVEGMAGDDETGYLYLAEEDVGIWRVAALDDGDKTLIAAVGDGSGLAADVEGVTIYHAAAGAGYIIASSQGNDSFKVYDREPPHGFVGTFQIAGVGSTDGIDVANVALDGTYPSGFFAFHNGDSCCPVQSARWDDIAAEVGGLTVDTTSWDPRASSSTCGGATTTTLPEMTTTTTLPDVTTTSSTVTSTTTSTSTSTTTSMPTSSTTTVPTATSSTTTTTLPGAFCGQAPREAASCRSGRAGRSSLRVSGGGSGSLKWKLGRGEATPLSAFGDPFAAGSQYHLCLYDAAASAQPRRTLAMPPEPLCDGPPCWRTRLHGGYRFGQGAGGFGGVRSAKLLAGEEGRAGLRVKASGVEVDAEALLAAGLELPVTIELLVGDGAVTRCWQTTFTAAKRNDVGGFKAKGP